MNINEPSLTFCKICGKPTNGMPFHTCSGKPDTKTPRTDACCHEGTGFNWDELIAEAKKLELENQSRKQALIKIQVDFENTIKIAAQLKEALRNARKEVDSAKNWYELDQRAGTENPTSILMHLTTAQELLKEK